MQALAMVDKEIYACVATIICLYVHCSIGPRRTKCSLFRQVLEFTPMQYESELVLAIQIRKGGTKKSSMQADLK